MLRHLLLRSSLLPVLWSGLLGAPALAAAQEAQPEQGQAARPAAAASPAQPEASPPAAPAQQRKADPPAEKSGARTARAATTAPASPPRPAEAEAPHRPEQISHPGAGEDADVRFAAMDTDVFVRASSTEEPVRWNQIVYENGNLVFGSRHSAGSIIWETALDLGEYVMNSILLVAGASEAGHASVLMKREIIGNHELHLQGDGRMDLSTANKHFTGKLRIDGAELRLRELGTLHRPASVQVVAGGQFVIDNSDLAHVINNRFRSGDIALCGGGFRYLTRDNAAAIEHIGTLTVEAGANRFEIVGGGSGQLGTTISIGQLHFSPAGSIDFRTSGGAVFSGRTNVTFQQKPELAYDVIARATINGNDWASIDTHNHLRAYSDYQTGSETTWGPKVNAAPSANQTLTADRSLASLKLSGKGEGGLDEDRAPPGRIVDLGDHSLTLTGAGLLATGDGDGSVIRCGTIHTTRENFEIHVSGKGGLVLENSILANSPTGATGLIKTGEGELVLSPPKQPSPTVKDNPFQGDIFVNQGTLTLCRERPGVANSPGTSIYVGTCLGEAILNIKGGSEQINNAATVTLCGGPKGEATFRLCRVQASRGPREIFHKLKVEGTGTVEFKAEYMDGAPANDNTQTILCIDELEIDGELLVRNRDQHDTHILLASAEKPGDELLSRIHFEKMGKVYTEKFTFQKKTCWEIKAEPLYDEHPHPAAPEPANYGGILGACAIVFFLWHRRRTVRRAACAQ